MIKREAAKKKHIWRKFSLMLAIIICLTAGIIAYFILQKAKILYGDQKIIVPLAEKNPVKEVEKRLFEEHISLVESPKASDSAVIFRLADNKTSVFFDAYGNTEIQISSLKIILNQLSIEGRKAKKIDLRFTDPIVVY